MTEAPVPVPTPHEQLQRAEATRLVHSLLDTLSEEQREAFVLAQLEKLSAPEIAEVLGLPVNTVYSRIRLARRAFNEAGRRLRAREERGR